MIYVPILGSTSPCGVLYARESPSLPSSRGLRGADIRRAFPSIVPPMEHKSGIACARPDSLACTHLPHEYIIWQTSVSISRDRGENRRSAREKLLRNVTAIRYTRFIFQRGCLWNLTDSVSSSFALISGEIIAPGQLELSAGQKAQREFETFDGFESREGNRNEEIEIISLLKISLWRLLIFDQKSDRFIIQIFIKAVAIIITSYNFE